MSSKKGKRIQPRGAALIMEKLFKSGFYKTMKFAESKSESIRSALKERQVEKRKEYSSLGVVCKFQAFNVYETNWGGLNEYLDDLGILPMVARFDLTELDEDICETIKKYQDPVKKYIRLTPNSNGRIQTEEESYDFYDDEQLIRFWLHHHRILDEHVPQYEKYKMQMLRSRLLKSKRTLSCNYGSVSLLDSQPSYNVELVYKYEGRHFLVEHAKVDMAQLDTFITLGFLSKKEVDQFRKLIDINLRYFVMDFETEKRTMDFFHRKMQQSSENRMAM